MGGGGDTFLMVGRHGDMKVQVIVYNIPVSTGHAPNFSPL